MLKSRIAPRLRALGTVALIASALPGISRAQQQELTPDAFAQKASLSNTFEIEAARLALYRAKDPAAKAFAQDMIKDHEQAARELAKAAREQNVPLPTSLDSEQQAKLDALKSADDANFDQAYLSTQIVAHEEAVALFDQFSKGETAGPLKSFALHTLGTLRTHDVRIHGLTKD